MHKAYTEGINFVVTVIKDMHKSSSNTIQRLLSDLTDKFNVNEFCECYKLIQELELEKVRLETLESIVRNVENRL